MLLKKAFSVHDFSDDLLLHGFSWFPETIETRLIRQVPGQIPGRVTCSSVFSSFSSSLLIKKHGNFPDVSNEPVPDREQFVIIVLVLVPVIYSSLCHHSEQIFRRSLDQNAVETPFPLHVS